jgi:AcrR family transcriptional regulator
MAESGKNGADGRLLRSERSREAIVKATFDLVGQGVLRPTAEQVAEAAGVGIRTVFRHFSDMDSLFSEMNARLRESALPLMTGGKREGSLVERVRGAVRQRAAMYEHIAPYRRAAGLSRWRSEYLQRTEAGLVREFRKDLLSWLPELEDEPELQEAADVALSFETWDRLRCQQRLGQARARETMERLLTALTADLA